MWVKKVTLLQQQFQQGVFESAIRDMFVSKHLQEDI